MVDDTPTIPGDGNGRAPQPQVNTMAADLRGAFIQIDMMRDGVWRLLSEQADDRKELRLISRDIAQLRVDMAIVATQVGAMKHTREVSALLQNSAALVLACCGIIVIGHQVGFW